MDQENLDHTPDVGQPDDTRTNTLGDVVIEKGVEKPRNLWCVVHHISWGKKDQRKSTNLPKKNLD